MSGRSISALLLLCVSLLGLPASVPAQSVVAPQKRALTLAERLDRLAAECDRNRIDLHLPHGYIESTEIGGRTILQVERVEVGVELAPDTFTLQPSTESGRGK